MINWFAMTGLVELVLGLMPGTEDLSLIGSDYDSLSRANLLYLSNDRLGGFAYSKELDLFWRQRVVFLAQLPDIKFGLSADGKVVPGTEAVEITLESRYTLCKRAPRGARQRVKEFFGKKSGK